jgi:hypothetical protein
MGLTIYQKYDLDSPESSYSETRDVPNSRGEESARMLYTLREWQTLSKNQTEFIVQASSLTMDDGWQPYPIGMGYGFLLQDNKLPDILFGPHDKLVMSSLRVHTDRARKPTSPNRESILKSLEERNVVRNEKMDFKTFYKELPQYKFIISPEGNGIDCHRHYEALMAGCVPVVEYNEALIQKYGNCPILYTTEHYEDINEEFLERTYETMLDTVFDFSKLYISNFNESMQTRIKTEGNFWCQKLARRDWYA